MTQLSAPLLGEMLAGRYRLDEEITPLDAWGRTIWRGTDTLLDRLVAIEMQIPGGIDATELIDTAIAASSIEHPGVAGVYDAVNESGRAFVIREWVDGQPLSAILLEGPCEPAQAAILIRNIATAVAAIHATGSAHGALTPDNVFLSPEGDVTLTNLTLKPEIPLERDIRAIGGLLYAALTSHWPLELGHQSFLPDAIRSSSGVCSPRQVRAGIPPYLDALTMDLLDPAVAAPSASELAAELYRYDVADPHLSALSSFMPEPPVRPTFWRRFVIPIGAVASILVAGIIVGTRGLPYFTNDYPVSEDPTKRRTIAQTEHVTPAAVSIFDPEGDGTELDGSQFLADGDATTWWTTDGYRSKDFGGIKSGMGVLIDLGTVRSIRQVAGDLATGGAAVQLRAAVEPGGSLDSYTLIAQTSDASSALTFNLDKGVQAQYLLLWFTALPAHSGGNFTYSLGISEVSASADKS